ncbi:hypothetical protein WJX82_011175 [Trebouxia sp. C0006]
MFTKLRQKTRHEPPGKQLRSMDSKWTGSVNSESPWPEYPRPQMQRAAWLNLNGVWEFAGGSKISPIPNQPFPERIVVPFPVESKLSGICRQGPESHHMWYRRTFSVPQGWAGQQVLLHFGAVDWQTQVWVNNIHLGTHFGGYDQFTFDITQALQNSSGNSHELLVEVTDPSDSANIAVGKQRLKPEGIWYTTNSGIWQTVWLEPVPNAHVYRLDLIPDIDQGLLKINVRGSQSALGGQCQVTASASGQVQGQASGTVGQDFVLQISNSHLWSPDDPFLYDLEVVLVSNTGDQQDRVQSYFGMRKISLGKVPGESNLRIMLNNMFLFQMGVLDQGFWPDGVYSAPCDEGLRYDIEAAKSMGLNMLRKHIKVEPDRWYYWADKLGVLVWQDMPSMTCEAQPSSQEKQQFEGELVRMIENHHSFPSVVMYVVFNEGWGQYETERLTELAKSVDPSRLVSGASGWHDKPVGDIIDMHIYLGPDAPRPTPTRAGVLGEFGGVSCNTPGHEWDLPHSFTYRTIADVGELTGFYASLMQQVQALMTNAERYSLSAAVFTALTDVELEIDGLMSYDRAVIKMGAQPLHQIHTQLIQASHALNQGPAGKKVLLKACQGRENSKHAFLSTEANPESSLVDLFFNDNSIHMVWTQEHVTGNRYRLRNHAGKYLSVPEKGNLVDLFGRDDDSGRQHWEFHAQGDNCFMLTMFHGQGREGDSNTLSHGFGHGDTNRSVELHHERRVWEVIPVG